MFVFAMFGDPSTEQAHQVQRWAASAIPIAFLILWLAGCAVIIRRKAN